MIMIRAPITRWLATVVQLPKPLTMVLALALAVLVGWLDHATGSDLEVTAIYLLPIGWAAWAAGRRAGLLLAVASVIVATLVDIRSGRSYPHPAILYWNAGMLLGIFYVAVHSLTAFLNAYRALAKTEAELRDVNEHLEETVELRTAALRSEIAERQRLEQEKVKAEQLLERQEKLAKLGTLTAGIAHEIRNPLTSIKARLYTLERRLASLPAALKDTDIINAEISRLECIVQDALSFARPADPKLQTLAADTLLREVHGLMATSLEGRAVKLVLEPGARLLVRADSGHLKQVLVNLVGNGADAIEGTGTVTLRARASRAALGGTETDVVILEVSDTGCGIPPEVEKRIFDPYFSTKETGTGLGLAIAARLVEKHGGRLEYQTRPGRGTTFSVVLPREMGEPASRASHSQDPAH